jgi:hypothetical protein
MTSKQLAYAIITAMILFLVVYFAKRWHII